MKTKCYKVGGDTADKIGNLEDCLCSTINRAIVAKILVDDGRFDLVYTILEDLAVGVQILVDEYCVKERE